MPQSLYDPPEIEHLDGRPYPKVSPKSPHGAVQLALGALIRACARGLGVTGTEVRFHVGAVDGTNTQFVPDISFVSKQRLQGLTERDRNEPPFAPDIAVEILSPGDDLQYLREKVRRYLATGSTLVLEVDTTTRRIHAYSSAGLRKYDCDPTFEHPAIPWLEFEVRDAFEDLDTLRA